MERSLYEDTYRLALEPHKSLHFVEPALFCDAASGAHALALEGLTRLCSEYDDVKVVMDPSGSPGSYYDTNILMAALVADPTAIRVAIVKNAERGAYSIGNFTGKTSERKCIVHMDLEKGGVRAGVQLCIEPMPCAGVYTLMDDSIVTARGGDNCTIVMPARLSVTTTRPVIEPGIGATCIGDVYRVEAAARAFAGSIMSALDAITTSGSVWGVPVGPAAVAVESLRQQDTSRFKMVLREQIQRSCKRMRKNGKRRLRVPMEVFRKEIGRDLSRQDCVDGMKVTFGSTEYECNFVMYPAELVIKLCKLTGGSNSGSWR